MLIRFIGREGGREGGEGGRGGREGGRDCPFQPKQSPSLLLVYINDLEEGVSGNILKFADDTKLFRKTKEIGDKQRLQDDIDKLVR